MCDCECMSVSSSFFDSGNSIFDYRCRSNGDSQYFPLLFHLNHFGIDPGSNVSERNWPVEGDSIDLMCCTLNLLYRTEKNYFVQAGGRTGIRPTTIIILHIVCEINTYQCEMCKFICNRDRNRICTRNEKK